MPRSPSSVATAAMNGWFMPGAGAVRQHVAGARTRRDEQQAGDALGVADRDAYRFCV